MRATVLGILVLVGVVSAGCGTAARQAAPVSAHTLAPAFVKLNATQAAGSPVVTADKSEVSLRAVPDGRFGLMLLLRNETHQQLVLENVTAVLPRGAFVRQLGTHLTPYFQCHPYCPRHIVMRGPFGAQQPSAVHVRPTRGALAQLNFAFGGCDALKSASTTPITQAIVVYRNARGRTVRQTLALSSSQLDLHSQGRVACRE